MKRLTEVDWHLYLADALPWRSRLLMGVALLFSREKRRDLAVLRESISEYRGHEQGRLAEKLFGPFHGLASAANPRHVHVTPGGTWLEKLATRLSPGRGMGLALASLALAAVLWPLWQSELGRATGKAPVEYTAKGESDGMRLFVKGDSLRAEIGREVWVTRRDTLQLLPLGKSQPFLAVFGYDAEQGLVRIFPAPGQGNAALQVSGGKPPPGLVLSSGGDNHLICVTKTTSFPLDSVAQVLRRSDPAVLSAVALARNRQEKEAKVQVFLVREKNE